MYCELARQLEFALPYTLLLLSNGGKNSIYGNLKYFIFSISTVQNFPKTQDFSPKLRLQNGAVSPFPYREPTVLE
jgi:hypothetical protein